MSKLVVAGVTQMETIVHVENLPTESRSVISGSGTIFNAVGGDAYNESLALKWLGDDVTFMSLVGRGFEMGLLNPADRKITLDTEYVLPILNDTPTEVFLFDKQRCQQSFEDRKDLRETAYDMSMVAPLVADSDMVVLSNANFCRPFASVAKEYAKLLAVNIRSNRPDFEKYNEDFLKAANILYFSDDVLDMDPFDFIKYIAKVYEPDIIILGQGNEGLILYDKKENICVHYDSVKTSEVVNTAGAGNALFSCFLHYYLQDRNSTAAIKNALLFASHKIGYIGTSNGFMTPDQISQWHKLIWGNPILQG